MTCRELSSLMRSTRSVALVPVLALDVESRSWTRGVKDSTKKIALGISEDEVPLGSHLVHFWRTEEEFECGVRFLQLGIADRSQYCVLFGHDEANQRVVETLRKSSSIWIVCLRKDGWPFSAASLPRPRRWRGSRAHFWLLFTEAQRLSDTWAILE